MTTRTAVLRRLAQGEATWVALRDAARCSPVAINALLSRMVRSGDVPRIGAPDACDRCGVALDTVAPGWCVVPGGVVCLPCLRSGEAVGQ